MPQIKIDRVVSFSSEDPNNPASNILSDDFSKKWKCKTPGEKNAVIVLQLEEATVISAIDIGNEHSAYIEVLVSRSGTLLDDYKVLLVMSSFMTPVESRNSQNTNKVRMFTKEQLSKPECDEKWDRVKVVCTQPFNKHVQYGLSFIRFHSTNSKGPSTSAPTQIGRFTLRPDSPDNLSIGSLFSKRKELKQEEKLTSAAAIRDAFSSPAAKPKLKINTPLTFKKDDKTESDDTQSPRKRNRNELLYSKDEEEPNEKIDKVIDKMREEEKEKNRDETKKEEKKKLQDANKKEKNVNVTNEKKKDKHKRTSEVIKKNEQKKVDNKTDSTPGSSKKRKEKEFSHDNNNKKQKITKLTKPFEKLLEGVTLVISGIQNPDRAILRSKALSMGAKYKPNWDNTCTHLICAFANTPKFNQVKGKGKIVKRTWIEDCHTQRKRLPWRRYALDKSDTNKDESEEEIFEQTVNESREEEVIEVNDFDDELEAASDTEERLARIQKAAQHKCDSSDNEDVYSAETDKEDFSFEYHSNNLDILNKLPDFFDDIAFYIDKSFDKDTYNKLSKYIIGYKGKLVELFEDVDIVVSTKENSENLKEINDNAECVSENWVWECHNKQKLVPKDDFLY